MVRSLRDAVLDAGEIADWFEAEGPPVGNEVPVSEYFLALLADVKEQGADKVLEAVELARGAGAEWSRIGEALDMSAEESERRFGRAGASAEVQPVR